jgi:hypothetical protein
MSFGWQIFCQSYKAKRQNGTKKSLGKRFVGAGNKRNLIKASKGQ